MQRHGCSPGPLLSSSSCLFLTLCNDQSVLPSNSPLLYKNSCNSQSVCDWMHHISCLAVKDIIIHFGLQVFLSEESSSAVPCFCPVTLGDITRFNTNNKLLQWSFNLITIHCAVKQAFVNWKLSMYNIHLWKQTKGWIPPDPLKMMLKHFKNHL